jgi:hypothetical protein
MRPNCATCRPASWRAVENVTDIEQVLARWHPQGDEGM